MKNKIRVRLLILSLFFVLSACVIIVRLYLVQVVHGSEYARDAMSQYIGSKSDVPDRMSIFMRSKDGDLISVASQQHGWQLAIVPRDVKSQANTREAIASIITNFDKKKFDVAALRIDDPYEIVAEHVSDADASRLRALKLSGIVLSQQSWRQYPGKSLAAQTIGFVGFLASSTGKVGVYGLERYWQNTLTLHNEIPVNAFAEIFTDLREVVSDPDEQSTGDIITTLEPTLQQKLEQTLDSVIKQYSPKLVGGIIMDPNTGAILAMSERPSFDLNEYRFVDDISVFSNHMVQGRYEMGSILKPITIASGIDSDSVSLDTKYKDTACIERSGYKICNFDHKGRGVVPLQDILNHSLNVGASFVAEKMGKETQLRYLQNFGLASTTGIELPDEVRSSLSSLKDGSDIDFISASFGQGIATSPIGMIRALATLANGGILVQPHIVSGIRTKSGVIRDIQHQNVHRVIATSTSQTITQMLGSVFDDALLNGKLKQEHYTFAAKTGTAQINNPDGGGYYADRYLHSFFGYFPTSRPQFIIFLIAVEPHGAEFASATLAKPFAELSTFIVNYYHLPPDR